MSYIDDLANVAVEWLAQRDIAGQRSLFCEAVLAFPIDDFLRKNTALHLAPEYDYKRLPGCVALDAFYYDFAAVNRDGDSAVSFLLELKFLKGLASSRRPGLRADILRLAMPCAPPVERHLLVVGLERWFMPDDDVRFLFAEAVLEGRDEKRGRIHLGDEIKKYANYRQLSRIAAKSVDLSSQAIVTCKSSRRASGSDGRDYKAVVWTVSFGS